MNESLDRKQARTACDIINWHTHVHAAGHDSRWQQGNEFSLWTLVFSPSHHHYPHAVTASTVIHTVHTHTGVQQVPISLLCGLHYNADWTMDTKMTRLQCNFKCLSSYSCVTLEFHAV